MVQLIQNGVNVSDGLTLRGNVCHDGLDSVHLSLVFLETRNDRIKSQRAHQILTSSDCAVCDSRQGSSSYNLKSRKADFYLIDRTSELIHIDFLSCSSYVFETLRLVIEFKSRFQSLDRRHGLLDIRFKLSVFKSHFYDSFIDLFTQRQSPPSTIRHTFAQTLAVEQG